MQRLGPIDLKTAVREWAEHEAAGRWAHLKVTAKQVLLVRDPIVREMTDPRDVYRARIDPSERSRIRLGTNDRTVATWRIEIQSDTNPNHAASRDHYARLTASDTPINTFGMLVLVETDSDDALIHVIDGFHRTAVWDHHCDRGNLYPIHVNVIVHHRLGISF